MKFLLMSTRFIRGRHTMVKAAAVAAATVVALTACSSGETAASGDAPKKDHLKIGMSLDNQLERRWQFDAEALVTQAKKNGDEVDVQYAGGDPDKQTQQVQAMLSRGIDVLVIVAADNAVAGTLIEQAKKDGVKTIAYDKGVTGGTPDWFISRPQDQVATLQTAAALKQFPNGTYAVLKGDAGNNLAQVSGEVYKEKLAAAGVKVVYDDYIKRWEPATAQRVAEDILTRNNDNIDAFMVNNDGMATGVIQALRGANKDGKVFVSGLDGDETNLHLIAQGSQAMTVFTPFDEMGRLAADAAHALGTGKTPEIDETTNNGTGDIPTKHVKLVEVNKDNLCEFVTKIAPKGWADPKVVFDGTGIACQ